MRPIPLSAILLAMLVATGCVSNPDKGSGTTPSGSGNSSKQAPSATPTGRLLIQPAPAQLPVQAIMNAWFGQANAKGQARAKLHGGEVAMVEWVDSRMVTEADGTLAMYTIAAGANGDSRASAANLLFARFVNTGKGWEIRQRWVPDLWWGQYGNLPGKDSFQWLDLGRGKLGWIIQNGSSGQGYTQQTWLLAGVDNGQIVQLANIAGDADNEGVGLGKAQTYSSKVQLAVVPVAGGMSQFQTTTTGSEAASGKVVKLKSPRVATWAWDEGSRKYVARVGAASVAPASPVQAASANMASLVGQTPPGQNAAAWYKARGLNLNKQKGIPYDLQRSELLDDGVSYFLAIRQPVIHGNAGQAIAAIVPLAGFDPKRHSAFEAVNAGDFKQLCSDSGKQALQEVYGYYLKGAKPVVNGKPFKPEKAWQWTGKQLIEKQGLQCKLLDEFVP
ncbi:hypothetical protein [Chitinilyticum litopenaei]|uniref:hypothetical protein n=1 Tax=Chitinilyticum litopenaei TaxID=1121276 RepID=UPI0005B82A5F|nr:hypothetical protein [Chitinilyticum litopenaei]